MRHLHAITWLFGIAGLSACGGGGGGSPPPPPPPPAAQFSVSQTTLSFAAADPAAGVPAAQTVTGNVTGTINGTTLYILITPTGSIIDEISNVVITGNSGSATVTPVHPLSLGTGTFTGNVTVRACVDNPSCATGELAGSPRVININYTVGSSVQQDSVMPRIVGSSQTGQAILRGTGLASVTAADFGGTAASNIDVRGDTEIAVTYPALTAGTHAVTLNGGTVPFTGALTSVSVPAFLETVLSYPDVPADIGNVLYDAEREAVLVAFSYGKSVPAAANNHVLRYAYNGAGWDAPTAHTVFRLRDIAFSNSGDRLLGVSDADMYELDPATLSHIQNITNFEILNSAGTYLRYVSMINNGYAFISGEWLGSGTTPTYLYSLTTRTFTNLEHRTGSVILGSNSLIGRVQNSGTGASGDGSRVAVIYGDSQSLEYSAGNGTLLPSSLMFSHGFHNYRASLDTTGSRMLISNGTEAYVYTSDNSVFCTLPNDTRAYAVNPAGTRGYVVDLASELLTFDLTTGTNGGPCVQVGAGVPIFDVGVDTAAGIPDSLIRVTITPDGQTLFIAGLNGLLVRPVP